MAVGMWNVIVINKCNLYKYYQDISEFKSDFKVCEEDGYLIAVDNRHDTAMAYTISKLKKAGLKEKVDYYHPSFGECGWIVAHDYYEKCYTHIVDNERRVCNGHIRFHDNVRMSFISIDGGATDKNDLCVHEKTKKHPMVPTVQYSDVDNQKNADLDNTLNFITFRMMGRDMEKYRRELPYLWLVNDVYHAVLEWELLIEELEKVAGYAIQNGYPIEYYTIQRVISFIERWVEADTDISHVRYASQHIKIQFDMNRCIQQSVNQKSLLSALPE